MKQVVRTTSCPVIQVDSVNTSKFYGYQGSEKGFISHQPGCVAVCINAKTLAKWGEGPIDATIRGVCEKLLARGFFVFEADTTAELFGWLSIPT